MSRSFGGRSLTTRSPIAISPPVISSSPATIRSVVVFPQPDGPTRTTNSLSRMLRFTSLTAWTSSYFLLRSFSTTCAMVSSPSNGFPGVGSSGRYVLGPRVRPSRAILHHPMPPVPAPPPPWAGGFTRDAATGRDARPAAEKGPDARRRRGPDRGVLLYAAGRDGGGNEADGPLSAAGLALDGAGEAGDVVLDEERIDDRDGDRAEQRPRHELAPEVDVATDELGDHADGNRFLLRRGEEDQRVDELVPRQREGEDPRREDAGHRDREDDPHHGAEARGPVDPPALLQLLRDRLEVAHEEPRAERDQERRVGEDQRPRRVAELEVADDVGERDEEQRRRHEICHEDRGAERARQRELQARERVPREQTAEERDDRRHHRDEERVPQPDGERRLRHEIAEVRERGRERPERRVVDGAPRAVELAVRADRRDQHPVERKQRADYEGGERDVEEHPRLPSRLDDRSACRHGSSS